MMCNFTLPLAVSLPLRSSGMTVVTDQNMVEADKCWELK